ncbi:hypothetical protein KIW84_030964 [Lathyrus oleraceus]|uniref:Tf2-1-like SH3-like domain-containing protein n=1 Tax=Pisum sativum TaxID=3888 RepID=A0A9D4XRY0_PEA|nr:hypothetical protein KIW84_030964 [Pisum sativum]
MTPRFIGPYQILERIGEVAYRVALPPSLANLHEVFHVSQLRRYIHDPSHVVQVDDVQVRDNLTVETSPMRIEDRELKRLRGKEIALVKVAWGGPAGDNVTWELESKMKESYPELFARGFYVKNRETIVKEEKGKETEQGLKVEERKAWSSKIRRINQTVIESVFGLVVKFRTYSFLRNRNRRSGSPPTAENAENSAFCLVLAQKLLFCLR